jgi:hypothetical protein
MVKKSYYIFVFVVGLIKMDLVFSSNDGVSSCIEDSVEEGLYIGVLAIESKPAVSSAVVKGGNTGEPTALKKSPKKEAQVVFSGENEKPLTMENNSSVLIP